MFILHVGDNVSASVGESTLVKMAEEMELDRIEDQHGRQSEKHQNKPETTDHKHQQQSEKQQNFEDMETQDPNEGMFTLITQQSFVFYKNSL